MSEQAGAYWDHREARWVRYSSEQRVPPVTPAAARSAPQGVPAQAQPVEDAAEADVRSQ